MSLRSPRTVAVQLAIALVMPLPASAQTASSPASVASEAVATFVAICEPADPSLQRTIAAAKRRGLRPLDDKARGAAGVPLKSAGGPDYVWRFVQKNISFEAFALDTGQKEFAEQCGVSFAGTTDVVLLKEVMKIVPVAAGMTLQSGPNGNRTFVDIPNPRWRSIRMDFPDASDTDLKATRSIGAAARYPLP